MNKAVVNILKQFFPVSSIYHNLAPITNEYPLIVYSTLIDVPALRADNKLYGSRIVYRITIIDKQEYDVNNLKDAFEDAGWLWENTNIIIDKNVNNIDEVYTSIDVSYLFKKARN